MLVALCPCVVVELQSDAQVVLRNREEDKQETKELDRLMKDTLTQKEQSVFMPAPREVLRPLFQADRAIKEKDMPRAVSLLGEVLSESVEADYLVPVPGLDGVSMSLRMRAQGVLGALPEKDRKLYRLRYGVQAKQMLERAIEASDFDGVSAVMQRFFFTDSGYDAAMLLGHYHLDAGRPVAAANCFVRVASSVEGRNIHDPEASVLLATCWMLGDSPERATETLLNLKQRSNQDSIEFMGRRIALFSQADQAVPWLTKLIGDTPLRDVEFVSQWVMSGGNPQRNARSGTGFPLISPRWTVPILNDPDLEKSVKKRQKQLIHFQSAPVPSVQPLAVGETIVMRSFDQMVGVDFKTGKRLWVYPPPDFSESLGGNETIKTRDYPDIPITERLWLDSVYGQASSDGKRIFVVPQPGFSSEAKNSSANALGPTLLHRTMNELKAIDIERQGAHLWEVGGATGLDEPKLSGSFFLGAPLSLGKELFVVGIRKDEVLLFALDTETGHLNWEQPLGTTETSLKITDDRYRRLAGATPSFSNGILVCATGTGALVGVDVSSRSMLWGYQYTSPGKKEVQPISPTRKSNSDPLSGIWRDSSITISQGKVLYTPVDSQDLICVELQNGYPVWDSSTGKTAKTPRNESLFVACVEENNAILLGETNVRAVSLKTGKDVWDLELGELGRPSGRGYANRGYYFFPTTAKKVVQIDLRNGQVVKTTDTAEVMGNLVCYRGEVISHGAYELATFPQDEPNQKLVELAELNGTMTPKLYALKSQLQLHAGFLNDALDSIEIANRQLPNRVYEELLLDLLIRSLNEDFEASLKRVRKYEERLLAERKFEYLAAKVNGLIKTRQHSDAEQILLGLLGSHEKIKRCQSEYLSLDVSNRDWNSRLPPDTTQIPSPNRIRLDVWVASQLQLIYQNADESGKQGVRDGIEKVCDLVGHLDADERYELLWAIPYLPAGTRGKLIGELLDSGQVVQAISIFRTFDSEANEHAAPAVAAIANKLVSEKQFSAARPWLDSLENKFASVAVSDSRSGSEFAAELKEQIKSSKSKLIATKWNLNSVTLKESDWKDAPTFSASKLRITQCDSELLEKYQFFFYGQTGEIEIRDVNGHSVHRFIGRSVSLRVGQSYNAFTLGRISIRDNIGIVDMGREIIVFDFQRLQSGRNPLLWHKVVPGGFQDTFPDTASSSWGEITIGGSDNSYVSRVYVTPADSRVFCFVDNTELVAVDALTGKELWRRGGILPASVLFADEEHVVAWNVAKRLAKVYSRFDGHVVQENRLPSELGSIWQAYGTRVLVSTLRPASDQGNVEGGAKNRKSKKKKPYIKMAKTLGLYDLIENKLVWEHEYPARDDSRQVRPTVGCRFGQNQLAIFQPNHDLKFLNVSTGEVEVSTPLSLSRKEREELDGIGLVRINGKYLVHLKFGYCGSRNRVNDELEYLYVNYSRTTWDGALLWVDPETGDQPWKKKLRFTSLQLGVNQPYNSPVYVFLRKVSDSSSGTRISKIQTLCVDLASGRLIGNGTSNASSGYQADFVFRCFPEKAKMEMAYDNTLLSFDFSAQNDLPPAPVAHLLVHNTIPREYNSSIVSVLDSKKLLTEKQASLERAKRARKSLPQRRAEEKRQLELEKSGS